MNGRRNEVKKRIWTAAAVLMLLSASCSMPVSVEKDNSQSVGKRNAELLQDKVFELGPSLYAIRVFYGEQLKGILTDFSIEGVYLIEEPDQAYYNLSEMVAMSVEDVSFAQGKHSIDLVF